MDPSDLVGEYDAVRPQYEAFTASLSSLLHNLLATAEIEFFAIEPRTKTTSSFEGKVHREDKSQKYRMVSDVTDLSGIRIIAYLQEDCDHIESLVKENFLVDEVNSVRKEDELDPDKFGYLSTHYVVSLGKDRIRLFEFSRFRGMKAEIQIRTLLQHTWAAIDWKFRYKEEREAPKSLRRRLFRISALLEAADNEFSAVRQAISELRERYSQGISKGELKIPLNTESARSFLATSETAQKIIQAAQDSGVRLASAREGPIPYQMLVAAAEGLGIESLEQLDIALAANSAQAPELFSDVVKRRLARRADRPPQLFASAMVRFVLLAGAAKNKRQSLLEAHPFPEDYEEALDHFWSKSQSRRRGK
jgi:ppGpp synthetase/RelA/SpoT-type nucleotidyltranferase